MRSSRPVRSSMRRWTPADEDGLAMLVGHLGAGCCRLRGDDERRCLGPRPARRPPDGPSRSLTRARRRPSGLSGGEDRQARRARSRRVGAPRSRPAGARADVRRPRAQGTPRPANAHGPAANRSDEPGLTACSASSGSRSPSSACVSPTARNCLIECGIPEVWRRSIAEAVAVVAMLDQRLDTAREGAASAGAC